MAKPSDLLGKSGSAGITPTPNAIPMPKKASTDKPAERDTSVTAQKPDLGHNLGKAGKAQGGGGGSSARPKV